MQSTDPVLDQQDRNIFHDSEPVLPLCITQPPHHWVLLPAFHACRKQPSSGVVGCGLAGGTIGFLEKLTGTYEWPRGRYKAALVTATRLANLRSRSIALRSDAVLTVAHFTSEVTWQVGSSVGHRGAVFPLRHSPPSQGGGGNKGPNTHRAPLPPEILYPRRSRSFAWVGRKGGRS